MPIWVHQDLSSAFQSMDAVPGPFDTHRKAGARGALLMGPIRPYHWPRRVLERWKLQQPRRMASTCRPERQPTGSSRGIWKFGRRRQALSLMKPPPGTASRHSVGRHSPGGCLRCMSSLRMAARLFPDSRADLAELLDNLHNEKGPLLGPYVFAVGKERRYSGRKWLREIVDRECKVMVWTIRDLRRTCSTGLAALHFAQDTIDRILGHAATGLASTNNRRAYAAEKHLALNA